MRKERFDLVFCLGVGCSGTQLLREAGLQLATFPLDWVGRGTVRERTQMVLGGFSNWLRQEDLKLLEVAPDGVNDLYLNQSNGLEMAHDFPTGCPLGQCFPKISEKYARRIARFLELLEKSRDVLIVWMGDARIEEQVSEAEVRESLAAFSKRYPRARFRMRVFDYRKGVSCESPQVVRGPGYEIVGLDFRDYADGNWIWAVHSEMLRPYLLDVTVKDYRPMSVRRAFRVKARKDERIRFKANSTIDLWLTKLTYRLCKGLWKRLERKGIEVVRPSEAMRKTGASVTREEHPGVKT